MSRLILAALLFSAMTARTAWAQSTAQINGTVKDQTGAVLPGAEVSVTQTDTGLKRSAISDETGSYILTSLPVGPYRLEVALPGFRTYVQTGIVLQVDSNPTIPVALQIGQVSEQVEVQANAALVETRSTGVGTVIDNQRVVELPLNGRNAVELIFLGGMASAGVGNNTIRNYPQITISVAGGLGSAMSFLLDGGNYNDAHNNQNLPFPFPDALQEFKVEASALPAQYGIHGAATVNAVTKSGTNEIHGDLFEFVRNGIFNARDFFAAKRDTLKRNQFGGVIGGPIRKNKLFFFGGYQGTIQRSTPPVSIAYVPTAAMLAGDFTTVASPACNNGRLIPLAASQGFVNNQISPSRFNSVALNVEKLLPVSSDPCGKITYGLISNQTEQLWAGRMDYQMSDKSSLFGRFTMANLNVASTYDGRNPLTISSAGTHYRVYSLALGHTYLIGSNIVSSFRSSMNRTFILKTADQFTSWAALGSNVTPLEPKSAYITVSGNGYAIGGGNAPTTKNATGPIPQVSEDLSVLKGAHQVGFGGNYFLNGASFITGFRTPGAFTFNGSVSGLSLADFLIGSASGWNQGNQGTWFTRYHYVGLYAQDAWKLNSRLTLNYGLRWEPYFAPYSKHGWFTHFDSALFDQNVHSTVYPNGPAGLIVPGDPQYTIGNHPEGSKKNIFVPRLGLVWDPKGNGAMTIRAAYGMFVDRYFIQGYSAFGTTPPVGNIVNLTNVSLSDPWTNYSGGNPFPLQLGKNLKFPLSGSYLSSPFDFHPMYMNQWNLSFQKQVGADWLVSASYLGNNTIHLISGQNLNPAVFMGLGPCAINGVNYPVCSTTNNTNQRRVLNLINPAQGQYYAGVNMIDDGGTSTYNGLNLSVQKRLSRGFTMLANHTWSHCIGDSFETQLGIADAVSRPGNRRANRGNCTTSDVRHVFNLSMVMQSPKFSSHALQTIAGNWQLSPILKIKSGSFFTVTTGVDNALTGQANQTPNPVPGTNFYVANKTVDHWLDPAAFVSPAMGTYGSLGYNSIVGPGYVQFDMALSRTFSLAEKKSLQLRGEAFNLPNHENLNNPVATLNSGSFGKVQSGNPPRIIQLALKLVF
jgi:hypothetical protein